MARTIKKTPLIEFKGTTLPVVSVTLRTLQTVALAGAAKELFGDEGFFEGDAAVIELDRAEEAESADPVDWTALRSELRRHGLNVIGVRGGSEALRDSAAHAGLPTFAAFKRAVRGEATSAPAEETKSVTAARERAAETISSVPVAPPPPPTPVNAPTLVIDRPLRSGQQAYARGGDLVVLAAVNAGAEVIADGSIHVYAPLRGRALAGAKGATDARIFTTRFEAELVSIAGVYRTFEGGVPNELAGHPVQVRLVGNDAEGATRLTLDPLATT